MSCRYAAMTKPSCTCRLKKSTTVRVLQPSWLSRWKVYAISPDSAAASVVCSNASTSPTSTAPVDRAASLMKTMYGGKPEAEANSGGSRTAARSAPSQLGSATAVALKYRCKYCADKAGDDDKKVRPTGFGKSTGSSLCLTFMPSCMNIVESY